ncbi:MAG: 30S ribosome-binding factor RbfA [Chloroflexi bacterium]|nr:30S ribosome-binding factor RbfA [Chloroflexota bacterium]MDA1240726.1 30S ribosome-binding factor RbfA [Chloroflexota bacterium]
MRHHDLQLRRVRRGRSDHHPPHGAGALSRRTEKVGDVMQAAIADLVRLRVKDHGLTDALFTFTLVDVSPDLAHARVHVSVMGDAEQKEAVIAGLTRSTPFLHRELTRELRMRRVPHLTFLLDESMEQADLMTRRLREVAESEGREF